MANYKILKLADDDEVGRIIREEMSDYFCKEHILIGEEQTCLPDVYLKFADSIKSFEVHDSDVIVASFPKTGTTWTQEMVWLIANALDYKGAELDQVIRFPFLELCTMFDWEKMDVASNSVSPDFIKNTVEFTKQQKSPRCIKTHLPFSLLPDEIQNGSKAPKIIYVLRNPKDTCVSFYHHCRLLHRYRTTLENFAKVFLADKVLYGPFWKHLLGYWEQRNSSNILIITYEDMKEDLPTVIKKVAKFLNKDLTGEQTQVLTKHLSFESMKENKAVNLEAIIQRWKQLDLVHVDGAFIRSGTVGKYKEELAPETIERFDAWIKRNIEGTDFARQYNYNL